MRPEKIAVQRPDTSPLTRVRALPLSPAALDIRNYRKVGSYLDVRVAFQSLLPDAVFMVPLIESPLTRPVYSVPAALKLI